jgi:hypothetical protein
MNIKEAREMILKESREVAESGEQFKVEAVRFESDADMMKQLMPEIYYGKHKNDTSSQNVTRGTIVNRLARFFRGH